MRRWSARCGQGPSRSPCPCQRPTGPLATSEHEGCGQRGFCRPPNSLRTAHPSGELRMMSAQAAVEPQSTRRKDRDTGRSKTQQAASQERQSQPGTRRGRQAWSVRPLVPGLLSRTRPLGSRGQKAWSGCSCCLLLLGTPGWGPDACWGSRECRHRVLGLSPPSVPFCLLQGAEAVSGPCVRVVPAALVWPWDGKTLLRPVPARGTGVGNSSDHRRLQETSQGDPAAASAKPSPCPRETPPQGTLQPEPCPTVAAGPRP